MDAEAIKKVQVLDSLTVIQRELGSNRDINVIQKINEKSLELLNTL